MTIAAIISDSHDNLPALEKALERIRGFNPELVIHGGDYIAPFTLKKLVEFRGSFYGVFGNNDGEKLVLSKIAAENQLTLSHQPLMFEYRGYRFVVLHGVGDLERTRSFVDALAASGRFDFVVYGHTHVIDVRRFDDTLIVNPGELCGYLTGKRTIAILDLEERSVSVIEV